MFAAGNGGVLVKDSCAFNGYVNNIYTIAITGIRSDGNIPVFGERCLLLWPLPTQRTFWNKVTKWCVVRLRHLIIIITASHDISQQLCFAQNRLLRILITLQKPSLETTMEQI